MTFKEKYLQDHPEDTEEDFEAVMENYCPGYFYEDKFKRIHCTEYSKVGCERCWNLQYYDHWHETNEKPPVGELLYVSDGKSVAEGHFEKSGIFIPSINWFGDHFLSDGITHWMLKAWPELPKEEEIR